jgi:Transposase DDE domain group 1
MMAQGANQLSFDFLPQADIVVQPHEGQITSDAGLLPVAQFDDRWGYTRRMAACLQDGRADPTHGVLQMLRQRLYGILADYEDCNDHDALRDEPVFKLVAGKLPDDAALASQPTLSRFENAVTIPMLHELVGFLVRTGIERLKEKNGGTLPDSVTLDLDATDDPAHGDQQLVLFHGYYGQYQYFPLVISEPTTKHAFLVWLRPGTVHAALGADDDLLKVVNALRAERPDVRIHVRGDAAFGMPWMYQACEGNDLTYTLGFSANPRLKRLTDGLMTRAVEQCQKTGHKQRLFTRFAYRADGWDRDRIVVAKAECHAGGTNLRFVITNLPTESDERARARYDGYIERGESEQRMDELKNGLHAGRLSCSRFLANFWRLLLHAAAYNLLNGLRDHQQVPEELRVAQPQTWRSRVIKVAAVVVQTTRRVVIRLAAQWPHWDLYRAVAARALTAPAAAAPLPSPSTVT